MHQTDPHVLDRLVKQRQGDVLRSAETGRHLALASRTPQGAWTLLGGARRRFGAALIRLGAWLQGDRRADRPELPPVETPPTVSPHLS